MITVIIFSIASVLVCLTNVLLFLGTVKIIDMLCLCIVSIIAMVAVNGVVAFVCAKILPDKWFLGDKKLFKASKKECRFYEKLGIKKWKDKTLELGKLNSFSKKSIKEDSIEYVERFIIENNKGFIVHFVSIFVSFIVIFVLPVKFWVPVGLPIATTSFIINYMSVMILRYNMPRLNILLRYAQRRNQTNSAIEVEEQLVKE